MGAVIWVEVLDRRGHVAARVRCAALPVTIGRAWSNDVVIDDRHVDPVHARLVQDEQGSLVVEDAGSLNGLMTAGGGRTPRVPVVGPTTVLLGQTTVRVVPADVTVGPAVPLPPATRGLRTLVTTPRSAALLALLGVAIAAAAFWLSDPDADSPRKVAGSVLALALVVATWSGVWALVGRATVQQARFLSHFAAAWVALMALDLAGVAGDYLGFMLNADGLSTAVDGAAGALLVGALLTAHFGFATTMARRRRVLIAAIVVAAVAGAGALVEETSAGDFDGSDITIRASVRPVPLGLVRTRDMDAFLAGTDGLKREVDRLAAEP